MYPRFSTINLIPKRRSAMSAEENKAVVRRFFESAASGEQDDVLIAPDIA